MPTRSCRVHSVGGDGLEPGTKPKGRPGDGGSIPPPSTTRRWVMISLLVETFEDGDEVIVVSGVDCSCCYSPVIDGEELSYDEKDVAEALLRAAERGAGR